MGIDPVTALAAATIGSTIFGAVQGQQQASAQKRAASQAQANAEKAAAQAEQDLNARNQKRPNTGAIMSAIEQAGRAGASGTMLTGASGVSPASLALGKTTLLGG